MRRPSRGGDEDSVGEGKRERGKDPVVGGDPIWRGEMIKGGGGGE